MDRKDRLQKEHQANVPLINAMNQSFDQLYKDQKITNPTVLANEVSPATGVLQDSTNKWASCREKLRASIQAKKEQSNIPAEDDQFTSQNTKMMIA